MDQPNVPASPGEPLSPVAIITGLVGAAITLAVSFGLDLTPEQVGAITGFVALAAPIIVWLIGRQSVTPSANVAAVVTKSGELVAGEAAPQLNGTPVSVTTDAPLGGGDL